MLRIVLFRSCVTSREVARSVWIGRAVPRYFQAGGTERLDWMCGSVVLRGRDSIAQYLELHVRCFGGCVANTSLVKVQGDVAFP